AQPSLFCSYVMVIKDNIHNILTIKTIRGLIGSRGQVAKTMNLNTNTAAKLKSPAIITNRRTQKPTKRETKLSRTARILNPSGASDLGFETICFQGANRVFAKSGKENELATLARDAPIDFREFAQPWLYHH